MSTQDTFPRTIDGLRAFVEQCVRKALAEKCDFCLATERVMEFADRAKQQPTVRMCHECWYCGLGPRWLHEFLPMERHAIAPPTMRNHGLEALDVTPGKREQLPGWAWQEETGA